MIRLVEDTGFYTYKSSIEFEPSLEQWTDGNLANYLTNSDFISRVISITLTARTPSIIDVVIVTNENFDDTELEELCSEIDKIVDEGISEEVIRNMNGPFRS